MCGISGIVGQDWRREQLESMVNVQHHRGPDDQGIFIGRNGKVGLGHNRLSILDLSRKGHQPMSNREETLWLTFNGEIYNYLELRAELSEYPYQSESDTEVILAAYKKWGEGCVNHFNGMFAFALWDTEEQKLFCARDRLGIKPFYYANDRDRFFFASEIKGILASGWEPEPNDKAIELYLKYGLYDHSEETFFKNIFSLEPGHTLIWKEGKIRFKPYWQLASVVAAIDPFQDPPKNWQEELKALIVDAVRLRLRSHVPLGVHLSGGLDSSVLLSVVDRLLPKGSIIETFTGSFGDKQYDETLFASEVSRFCGVRLNECSVDSEEFWDVLNSVQKTEDQPFGALASLVMWKTDRLAKNKGISVLLEGQGGDELFGGYHSYLPYHVHDLLKNSQQEASDYFLKQYANNRSLNLKALTKYVKETELFAFGSQDGTRHLRPEGFEDSHLKNQVSIPVLERPSKSSFANARFQDIRFTKLPRVLRFNDHTSMANSCELRVPYLDHRIVEYSFKLPGSLLLSGGLPKWPIREIFREDLPEALYRAPKRAVVTPQSVWFRNRLRQSVSQNLEQSELVKRGYLKRDFMVQTFREFCENPGMNNSFFVWQWINLDTWFKTFFSKEYTKLQYAD